MPALPGLDAGGFEGDHAADEDGGDEADPDKVPANVGEVLGPADGPGSDPGTGGYVDGRGHGSFCGGLRRLYRTYRPGDGADGLASAGS